MTVLSEGLTADQEALLETVWRAYVKHNQWPVFQYVEAALQEQQIDALRTLASFPCVGSATTYYSAVWYERAGRSVPSPESRVALTLAGLRHVSHDLQYCARFLSLLRLLVEERRCAPYSPIHVVMVNVTRDQVSRHFRGMPPETWEHLHAFADREPPTRTGLTPSPREGDWWRDVGPHILDYADITDLDDYLSRVTAQLEPPRAPAAVVPPPPRGLVGAIDYLDTVWQLRFKTKLVQIDSLERAAMLALPVETSDAFDAALSAFTDVLAHLSVPHQAEASDKHPLTNMGVLLNTRLKTANHERISKALTTLNRIKTVRHGVQHAKASPKAADALRELGIGYPIPSWAWAWDAIRFAGISAFDALREEIQVSRRATQAPGQISDS